MKCEYFMMMIIFIYYCLLLYYDYLLFIIYYHYYLFSILRSNWLGKRIHTDPYQCGALSIVWNII